MSKSEHQADPDRMNQVRNLLTSRRTLPKFSERPVDQALVFEAIDVARWVPNHHLTEPWHFYVLGPEAVETTIECVRIRATEAKGEKMGRRKARRAENVPSWVVVTCKRSDDEILQREDYAATSCAIHNMSLYLWEAGVGMKWCTGSMANTSDYANALGIDSDAEFIVGILRIGYPLDLPSRNRKPASDVTTILK